MPNEHKPELNRAAEIERKAFETKDVLTFEEFTMKRGNSMNMYNNFPALFYKKGFAVEILRGQGFFKKFQEENPELEESLTNTLSELSKSGFYEIPKETLEGLYTAYTIMLSYDEIKTSNDLFK